MTRVSTQHCTVSCRMIARYFAQTQSFDQAWSIVKRNMQRQAHKSNWWKVVEGQTPSIGKLVFTQYKYHFKHPKYRAIMHSNNIEHLEKMIKVIAELPHVGWFAWAWLKPRTGSAMVWANWLEQLTRQNQAFRRTSAEKQRSSDKGTTQPLTSTVEQVVTTYSQVFTDLYGNSVPGTFRDAFGGRHFAQV